ncbi:hypothetical protein NDU88_006609 [Pleurodeles waltl]|uniref:Uncharacterized protein n=1 Tax=Pleurodeles waltl TaxID=8319 RepID=A0AAV7QLL2_PLEWA|nr:hypothetical protein NDU88_006609 [Pleurodeles waltl]
MVSPSGSPEAELAETLSRDELLQLLLHPLGDNRMRLKHPIYDSPKQLEPGSMWDSLYMSVHLRFAVGGIGDYRPRGEWWGLQDWQEAGALP